MNGAEVTWVLGTDEETVGAMTASKIRNVSLPIEFCRMVERKTDVVIASLVNFYEYLINC
jgi:hypothetical protein